MSKRKKGVIDTVVMDSVAVERPRATDKDAENPVTAPGVAVRPEMAEKPDHPKPDAKENAWNAALEEAAAKIRELTKDFDKRCVSTGFFIHDEILKLKR